MYEVIPENSYLKDYKQFKRRYPYLISELRSALEELEQHGKVSNSYHPHALDKRGGNYNGHIDFHLSDGEADVIVLYLPHKSNPVIRLVRIGSHDDLFQGDTL